MSNLTQQRLHKLLDYDPDTGVFVRLSGRRKDLYGKPAGVVDKRSGGGKYIRIDVDGEKHYAHRLAYLYVVGEWPEFHIDHKDLNGLNNRWNNLRQATVSQNLANRCANKNNTTGFKGVRKKRSRFHATIKVNGKQISLGGYADPASAHAAYAKAARLYFGEYARSESDKNPDQLLFEDPE